MRDEERGEEEGVQRVREEGREERGKEKEYTDIGPSLSQ